MLIKPNVACWYHTDLLLPVQETSKVTVEALVSWYKLVWEGQTRHKTSLLKPEDGTEAVQKTCNAYTRSLLLRAKFTQQPEKIYLPEKKIPSTHAKATSLTAKDIGLQKMVYCQIKVRIIFYTFLNLGKLTQHQVGYLWIQSNDHFAFLEMQGMVSIALNNLSFSCESFIYVSRSKLYISRFVNKKSVLNQFYLVDTSVEHYNVTS